MRDGIFLYSSCGSPNYAAPELINGRFYNGTSIDVWSCGVILFTLLNGTLPFNEENKMELRCKITKGSYSFHRTVPEPAKDLITRMLQVNPMNRITIPEIKQHSWFKNNLLFIQEINNYKFIYGNRSVFDDDVIRKMQQNEQINAEKLSFEELKKTLESKTKRDLNTIYEILYIAEMDNSLKEKMRTLKSKEIYFI